mmetsp:Transcript_43351/g.137068  ORF Transcript_43351/g.137068 Transcript_43351/m.137068 type:complete len:129 (-) Transcript_43351:230-616(-)
MLNPVGSCCTTNRRESTLRSIFDTLPGFRSCGTPIGEHIFRRSTRDQTKISTTWTAQHISQLQPSLPEKAFPITKDMSNLVVDKTQGCIRTWACVSPVLDVPSMEQSSQHCDRREFPRADFGFGNIHG